MQAHQSLTCQRLLLVVPRWAEARRACAVRGRVAVNTTSTPAPQELIQISDLRQDYGVAVSTLRPHAGGFESDCWVADDVWFVKVWRQQKPPTGLGLLHELQALGLPVPAPIPTVSGP